LPARTLLAVLLLFDSARADELPPARRAAAAVAAVAPGIVVPGLGHFVAGRPSTGRKLLIAGGAGFGTTLAGVTALALTGASGRTVGPIAFAIVAGTGTWLGAVLADLYGVVAPEGRRGRGGEPARLALELGYRHVYDPTASYRHFAVAGAELRGGRFALEPSVWAAVHQDNLRGRVAATARLAGPFELGAAITLHRFGEEGFTTLLGELTAGVRVELGTIDARLGGAFAAIAGGVALGGVRYHDIATDYTDLLLGTVVFGVHLGPEGRGRIALAYDHRHDDFAAGLKMPGLGSGPAGHFGLSAQWFLASGWGVRAEVQAGSAWVSGASLVWRR
jgi:hypothetical protein